MGSACCTSKDKASSATTPNTAKRPDDTETPSESEYESDMSVSMSDAESYIVKTPAVAGYTGGKDRQLDALIADNAEKLKQAWRTAVENKSNTKIKTLFKNHRKKINFLLIEWENGDNTLHIAAKTGNTKLTKFLMIVKMNINKKNRQNGNTALHYATMENQVAMTRLILKTNNTDITIVNKEKKTAEEYATNKKIIKLFKAHKRNQIDGDSNAAATGSPIGDSGAIEVATPNTIAAADTAEGA